MASDLYHTASRLPLPSRSGSAYYVTVLEDQQQHSLAHKASFEEKLEQLSGRRAANAALADQFNENGLLREVAVTGTSNPSSASEAQGDQQNAVSVAEKIARAFLTMEGEELANFLSDIIEENRKVGATFQFAQEVVRGGRVMIAELTPQNSTKNLSPLLSSHQSAASEKPGPHITESIGQRIFTAAHDGDMKARLPLSPPVLKAARFAGEKRNLNGIRVALRELDVGIHLTIKLGGLSPSQLRQLRVPLLSMLALHGLGNYRLQLNDQAFFSRLETEEG